MNSVDGLVFAFLLNGKGGGARLDLDGVRRWQPGSGPLWVHLDYKGAATGDWLTRESGIDPTLVEALTADEPRPRSLVYKGGLLAVLRGINLNPDADPEDMVSIRVWIDPSRIVTLRHRRVMAIDDIRTALESGNGPTSVGDFLEMLADRLVSRMGVALSDLDDSVDALEDEVLSRQTYELRQNLSGVRRTAIALRRYLAPQRDVMERLHAERVDWLSDTERMRLRESADRITRYVEDLDAIRDRATVMQEELNGRLAEQMNKTMYILSIVAGLFLPLGFLTGLLGINVGGIPGTESHWAFAIFCILLGVVASVQIWFFRRKKWI